MGDRRSELLRQDGQMRLVRWLLVPFALAQFLLYRPPEGMVLPFPRLPVALGVVGLLVAINLASLAAKRTQNLTKLEWVAGAQLVADVTIGLGIVWLFSFDSASALWALLILPVLEGAIRSRLRGALITWAAVAAGYVLRGIWAAETYPHVSVEVESFTYRLGIILIVAIATGSLAQNLESMVREHGSARRESERRADLLHVVAEGTHGMTALNERSVLAALVDANIAIGFDCATVAMLDAETGLYTQPEHRGLPEAIAQIQRPSSQGLIGEVCRRDETVVVADYGAWARALPEVRTSGFQAAAGTPVRVSGDTIGVVIVAMREAHSITTTEVECLELLAAHASTTLTTIRYLEGLREAEAQLEHEALHDSLTGLPNRTLFLDRLSHCLERKVGSPTPTAVLFFDLDGFKRVNDSLGHEAGDEALREVAARVQQEVTPADTLARYGGDEFVLLVEEAGSVHDVVEMADRVVDELRVPLMAGAREVHVSVSVGVAYRDQAGGLAQDLLHEADLAANRAKQLGGARSELYEPSMSVAARHRMEFEHELRRAIDRDELRVHYQPAIDSQTQAVVGLEALVRWEHPVRGLLPAAEFVPFAEQTGLIVPIGHWVLQQVADQARAWRQAGVLTPLPVGVNLSATEFAQPDFVERVTSTLASSGLGNTDIVFEVTESVLMRDDNTTLEHIEGVREAGLHLAIDDFGLGYSSLSYLKRYRFSILKIDRSFVADVAARKTDQAIVRYILALAGDLGLPVVAEGVETAEQLRYLQSIGCRYVQGFHICRPLPPDLVERFVADSHASAGVSAN